MQKLTFLCLTLALLLLHSGHQHFHHCWHLTADSWTYHHQKDPTAVAEEFTNSAISHLKYPNSTILNRIRTGKTRINCHQKHPFIQSLLTSSLDPLVLRNVTQQKEAITSSTAIAWDAYRAFAWGPLTADRAKRAKLEPSVALAALITFTLMKMPDKAAEAKAIALKGLSSVWPPPLELFPHLVTAYQLTEERRFLDAASQIASTLSDRKQFTNILCDRWTIEAIAYYSAVVPFRSTAEYTSTFKYCKESLDWWKGNVGANETTPWSYYYTLVNLHRYSNFYHRPSLDQFNAWLAAGAQKNDAYFAGIKLFSSKAAPPIAKKHPEDDFEEGTPEEDQFEGQAAEALSGAVYLSKVESQMAGVDCGWGATFLLAGQARRDSVLIGSRPRPASVAWDDSLLLATGQNITETCRQAAAVTEPRQLLKRQFTLIHDFIQDASDSTVSAQNRLKAKSGSSISAHSKFLRQIVVSYSSIVSADLFQPQLALSYLTAYRVTRDDHYRDFAWKHFLALQDYVICKVDTGNDSLPNYQALAEGYAGFQSFVPYSPKLATELATTFFGQTMRYLYLTFEADWVLPLSQYVFTATGNPIKILTKAEFNL